MTSIAAQLAQAFQPMRGFMAWLLQTNRPVPERSNDEIAAEVERNYTWNFVVNLLDGAFFWFGASFISTTTILPLFISKLTDDPLPIGLLAVLAQAGWFLPQLFTANLTERLPRKKPIVVNLGLFTERLPLALLVVAALLAPRSAVAALVVFFIGYAWHAVGAGAVGPSWQDLVARCFPVERRGRFLGLTSMLGAGMGALGAGFSTWLLRTLHFPQNFVVTFAIAATAIFVSWLWLALAREPVQATKSPRVSNRDFLKGLPDLVRRDHNFARFLGARTLMALGSMGTGFITVHVVEGWQVPDSTVGMYTAMLLVGQTIGSLAFGFLADRTGHKLSLELAILASCTGFLLAWLATTPAWFYIVFVLVGVGSSAVMMSGLLMVMEFCVPERRPTYVGVANTAIGLAGVVGPLAGGILARSGYTSLFIVSAFFYLLAWVMMRWLVREPRWTTPV